ncbi:chorismate mutase [Desulfonatronovibrio hydrogenovorans]|uniref:chorismate mutase n=1 Tax=Desulfonatronovibrio hydrogenovorans TaxID=53245 RepID=UPI00048DF8B4|nr:chorismate mutase [Desulfonatronovibrio hydrogenovorans]
MKKYDLSLTDELKSIDRKIASLISKRSRLMGRVAKLRQQNSKSLADAALEKELWILWKEELKKSNQSLVRQLYTLVNSLGYSMAEKASSDKPFCLYPPNAPVSLDIPGPSSISRSLYTAFLCLQTKKQVELAGFIINDNIIELIKMANQCGAGLTWQDSTLASQGGHDLDMDNQSLFINHSLQNFYLFLCLALGQANRLKFNSSSMLKTVDLKRIQHLLPQLGARLSSIEPQSYSLPARLETSGQLPREIHIPAEVDPLFVACLTLAAPSYEHGLAISYPGLGHPVFSHVLSILEQTGINLSKKDQQVVVHPGQPDPDKATIFLDPFLSGFVLAMAHLSRGKVSLSGVWPAKDPVARLVQGFLKQCGADLKVEAEKITAVHGTRKADCMFDLTDTPEAAPLALPLALCCSSGEDMEFLMVPDTDHYHAALDFLTHAGYDFSTHSRGIRVGSHRKISEKNDPWISPDPYWILGYCLLSFKHKGICLANPGLITALWPGFWKIFTNLSGKLGEKKPSQGDLNDKPSRRRIRI